jgi:hypothetical protein
MGAMNTMRATGSRSVRFRTAVVCVIDRGGDSSFEIRDPLIKRTMPVNWHVGLARIRRGFAVRQGAPSTVHLGVALGSDSSA